jgi:hypothetical protein
MNWLAENALPIWMGGAVALTMAFIVYWQTGANGALLGILGVIVATAALLLTEWLIETPREAVERTLYELADAVEANDVEGALRFIAPGASQIRKDVETLMPLVKIDTANIVGNPLIEIDYSDKHPVARVECRGFVHGTLRKDGMRGGEMAKMVVFFIPEGDRWLVSEYVPDKDWRGAVGRPKNNQAK